MNNPPDSRITLYWRARALVGLNVAQVAKILGIPLPTNPKLAKGFVGQLAEIALGATAGANPIQDFPDLGVELKTIPISPNGQPAENTHVCILLDYLLRGQQFATSNVLNKLSCVLWLPIEGDTNIPLAMRKFGKSFFWVMNEAERAQIQCDWEEIMEALVLERNPRELSALGKYLQLKPAGKRNNERQYGFYLRKKFTNTILERFLTGELEAMQEQIIPSLSPSL